MFYYDSTMLIVLPALILTAYAQFKVNNAFSKYSRIYSSTSFTGETIARAILAQAGITDVRIELFSGSDYGDHFDPTSKVIRLSNAVFNSSSVSALGIAAHECGHAIQNKVGYVPNKIRATLVPLANIGSKASIPLLLIGLALAIQPLQMLGILFFSLSTMFYLVTLPVEFNASHRAVKILRDYMPEAEISNVKEVLSAAALTYLAAALTSILQLVRLISLSRRDDRRR